MTGHTTVLMLPQVQSNALSEQIGVLGPLFPLCEEKFPQCLNISKTLVIISSKDRLLMAYLRYICAHCWIQIQKEPALMYILDFLSIEFGFEWLITCHDIFQTFLDTRVCLISIYSCLFKKQVSQFSIAIIHTQWLQKFLSFSWNISAKKHLGLE